MVKPIDFDKFIAQSMEELRLKTQCHDSTWHLGEADWSVDQDQGKIAFSRNGVTATAPVQIVGTFNSEDSTWLWGWDHPSVMPALREHAMRVREFGSENGINRLTTRKLTCSEDEAWELVAIACKLCEAQGAYRGPAGNAFVFMTFGEVTLAKSACSEDEPVTAMASKPVSTLGKQRAVTSAPAQVVHAFIAAYFAWNTAAINRTKALLPGSTAYEAAVRLTTNEYDDLISRFCASSVKRQGIAYGSDPMHHPEHETVESASISGSNAIVQTLKVGLYNFVSEYEYHLVDETGEWRIASLLYIDESGKHECL